MEKLKAILRRVGPGFIVASVVLGPGSIVAASRAGAEAGYSLLWALAGAVVMMAVYTSMGARLGCALDTTPLVFIARRVGRWLAFLAGLSGFLVVAGFQFGNNLGVAFAVSGMVGGPLWIWPVVFTSLSLIFLLLARELYRMLERMMLVLVLVMIISFVANLFWSGFSGGKLFSGLVPRALEPGQMIIVSAMLATTFSVVGAFYQAYLVRAKGWKREDLRMIVTDALGGHCDPWADVGGHPHRMRGKSVWNRRFLPTYRSIGSTTQRNSRRGVECRFLLRLSRRFVFILYRQRDGRWQPDG